MPNDALASGTNMRADWDARADDSPLYWIAMTEDDKEFLASGERDLRSYILNDITLHPRAAVLEIGCGIGRLLRAISPLCHSAVGVDVSPRMIELSRIYLDGLSRVKTYTTPGATLPDIASRSIDFAFSYICFQHIPQRGVIESYIRETFRVLKPGGIFKFQVDGNVSDRRPRDNAQTWLGVCYTPEEIKSVCADAGFLVHRTHIVPIADAGSQYLWVVVRRPARWYRDRHDRARCSVAGS